MRLRLSAIGLALVAQTALFTVSTTFAQDATSQTQSTYQDDPSLARQTLEWSQDRLAELDATIAVLEQDATRLQDEARAKAEDALKALREQREAYRIQTEEAVANARAWTDAQIAEGRESLDANWTAFQTARDEYLEAAKADLATRRAVLEIEFEARQKVWQKSIDELRNDADRLAADQRAAIDVRIAALNAQVEEAKARLGHLEDASAEAWETTKNGYADAQQLFLDTYASIRKSIEDATK
ncbi:MULTISPECIES: hypothetical protein [Alphaproteobacteria]|uniref:Uncharacterized protein n=2 Tax=Alphaproteobacteria TaxID=28211 RepID=A0A512HPX2_9HYPH|nr:MULTISPECIES: hypothetical protein [Alphaproteobacteria]GEO87479.1 hypothetical protein RNA01_44110 [Ciceribacter naphthalenivorans]GLR23553.1 hypothetical protein GCM10007920_33450 [Ciceribacter naphthalenivorans]GLT06409.1 hypothetical protein GCM10007926_33450 [Sphingomonas psychrolutea]